MAITSFWNEAVAPARFLLHFTSDLVDATFYVWVDGRLYGTTTAATMEVMVGLGQVSQVEVFDDAGDVPAAVYPATVTLLWEVAVDVPLSRVEQWDVAEEEWVVRASVPSTGRGLGRWESAPLADSTAYLFRVVPVDGTGRDGVTREFSGVMCRWPDAPELTVVVAGGELEIS